MTQEEQLAIQAKAKRYDEAIERAVERYNEEYTSTLERSTLAYVFPALKESEDEKIRKEMIEILKKEAHDFPSSVIAEKLNSWIAWLEKQGSQNFANSCKTCKDGQKPADKVEPNLLTIERAKEMSPFMKSGFENESATWSEDDEKILNLIIARLHSHPNVEAEEYGKDYHWLKSIKERYTWKPSDEQMNALNYVVNLMASSERPTENDLYYNILKSLRQQLMKLKG